MPVLDGSKVAGVVLMTNIFDIVAELIKNLRETGKEELLVPHERLKKTFVLRRILNPMGTVDAIEFLISKLKQTKTNSEFFEAMKR